MIKVALVRGKYLNNFEGQNYIFDKKKIAITGFSSLFPFHKKFPFPVVKLPSLVDLGINRLMEKGIKYLTNRVLGDGQILFGLENYSRFFDIFDTADPHYFYSYQLAKLKAKNLIKKLMVTYCETIPFNNESVAKKRFIKYFTLKWADLVICHSQKSKEALIREGVDLKKIKILKLGVDLKKFKAKKRKKKNDKKNFEILFVGRLVKEKGIIDLYQAFKEIKKGKDKIKDKITLRVVGDGDLKKYLIERIKDDQLEKEVKIESRVYEKMPEVYQQADLLVVPSKTTRTWEEQYGMVLIEGMASGLPIIAYESGAIGENLGQGGIKIKEGDIRGLIEAIVFLIKDEKMRLKLGKMGKERAKKYFDAAKTALKLEKIYEKLIGFNL